MGKLIARRSVQYQGRAYERGAVLPAHDSLMTAAWLRAGSAAWEEAPEETADPASDETRRRTAERQAAEVLASCGVAIADGAGNFVGKKALVKQLLFLPAAESQAVHALRALGVEFTDAEGHFVGGELLKEQLCSLAQESLPDCGYAVPPPDAPAACGVPEEITLDTEGHWTRERLSRLNKAELLALAEDRKVDLSQCRTNAERVEALAAVGADAAPDGGASPHLPLAEDAT